MSYLFTSESVSEGHPDKIADQISDALVDHFLAFDPAAKVACETLVTTGQVVLAGEVKSKTYLDVQQIARDVIRRIGYTKSEYMFEANSCGILSAIHEQSPDINQGVEREKPEDQGAGDQGMMFGYACTETPEYMPAALMYAHKLVEKLADIRKNHSELMPYLRPDAKAQVTIAYNDAGTIEGINTIVISTQHDPGVTQEHIASDIKQHVIPAVIPSEMISAETVFHINPTGKFEIGGPHGDTGLTGRKIIVDTYGGKAPHGGGAFSGKDPTKVDRSAAYAARHAAKNIVAAGIAKQCEIQISYAIGVATPTSIYVNTFGTSDYDDELIIKLIQKVFDFRPQKIIENFDLQNLPAKRAGRFYQDVAKYGHFGRKDLDLPWERLDKVEELKRVLSEEFHPLVSK